MTNYVSKRIVAYSLAALIVQSALLLVLVIGCKSRFGGDFASFWAAARLALEGIADKAYDLSVHQAAETILPDGDYRPFFYPPTFLLLCVPLGLLPFHLAIFAFLTVTGVVYVWATTRVAS